ncbi:MAG: DUF262 domain-containing protein [bacterium]|nr:DUF262 domain-containing protein [bacterium]
MGDYDDRQVKLLELREIANWQLEFKDAPHDWVNVKVPTFQRGLVWNAAQIEVLWDSLLRGIPIGSFSLLPMRGGRNFEKNDGEMKDDGYWLLDGQQRSNAIALGYSDFPDDKLSKEGGGAHAVLWIDLLPDATLKKRSNRKYFFYVTTEGRPWGYEISDANGENRAGKVSPQSYRKALNGISSDTVRPPLRDLWPVSATLPIPFCVFRKWVRKSGASIGLVSYLENEVELGGLRWYQHLRESWDKIVLENRDSIERIAADIKAALMRTSQIRILAMVAPEELSRDTSDSEKNEDEMERDSEIAVYFARLNKNGTIPSKEDLNYSILKSANPVLGRIDKFAANLMHPARLADLAMRVFKSSKESHSFVKSVSRRDAFSLGVKCEFAQYVTCVGEDGVSEFKKGLDHIRQWVKQDVPPVLMAQIARNNPNLYQLMILLAGMSERVVALEGTRMTALITLLAWFGNDNSLNYQALYKDLQDTREDVVGIIRRWLFDQIGSFALNVPPTVVSLDNLMSTLESGEVDFSSIMNVLSHSGSRAGLERLWHWERPSGRALLLYGCRRYLNDKFKGYDPASAAWSEDSRPWDYDHIIPQGWLISGQGNRQGDYHVLVNFFLNSIGNIAPIPFSENRAKHDDAPGTEYLSGAESRSLVYVNESNYEKLIFFKERPQKWLEEDPKSANLFSKAVLQRFKMIYEDWLQLPVFEWLDFSSVQRSMRKSNREKLVNGVKAVLEKLGYPESVVRVVFPQWDTYANVVEKWDWARPYFCVGKTVNRFYWESQNLKAFACIEEQPNGSLLIGFRGHPDEKNGSGWFDKEAVVWDIDEALMKYQMILKEKDREG